MTDISPLLFYSSSFSRNDRSWRDCFVKTEDEHEYDDEDDSIKTTMSKRRRSHKQ